MQNEIKLLFKPYLSQSFFSRSSFTVVLNQSEEAFAIDFDTVYQYRSWLSILTILTIADKRSFQTSLSL